MGGSSVADGDGGTDDRTTLSTGETVELPLATAATIYGAVVSARTRRVAELLPAGLSPITVGPGRAAVTVLTVEYDRIGEDAMAPYDEVAVLFPAVEDAAGGSLSSLLSGGIGGYVWYMPVTTDSAEALGVEVWGYPKVVADVDHEETDSGRRTTVSVDGESVLSISIDRPPVLDSSATGYSYTEQGGRLHRQTLDMRGDVGLWPCSSGVSYTLGGHDRAETLRSLDLGGGALARLYADGEFVVHAGEQI